MRSTHSFSIDFITRKSKENKLRALIYARVTVNGERAEISLKEFIDAKDWHNEKQMVKGRTIEVQTINSHINDVRYRLKEKYRLLEDQPALITAEAVKQSYLGKFLKPTGHDLLELLAFFKKIWEGKLKKGGFKNYDTTIDYLKLFLASEYPSGNVYLSELSMELTTNFEHYVRNNPIKKHDPCLGNGVSKHIQRFKRIVNWAAEIKWMPQNPFEKYSCPLKKSKRKKLTIRELVTLENKEFTDPSLNYVKELFLYSCYTGLAFVDAMALSEVDFEWDADGTVWCKIYRTKSDGLCPVPLLPSAKKILAKYAGKAAQTGKATIFSGLTNQYVNRCLKVIKEACEILTPMTYHVARHTFAKTVALKNGIPLETVQMMLGHTKISTTLIYADVDEEKIMSDMAGLEGKLEKKREMVLVSQDQNSETHLVSSRFQHS